MLYLKKTFTLPAAPVGMGIDQRKWDYAVMNKAQFIYKYGTDATEYSGTSDKG